MPIALAFQPTLDHILSGTVLQLILWLAESIYDTFKKCSVTQVSRQLSDIHTWMENDSEKFISVFTHEGKLLKREPLHTQKH
jgi:hypothetical protein